MALTWQVNFIYMLTQRTLRLFWRPRRTFSTLIAPIFGLFGSICSSDDYNILLQYIVWKSDNLNRNCWYFKRMIYLYFFVINLKYIRRTKHNFTVISFSIGSLPLSYLYVIRDHFYYRKKPKFADFSCSSD